MKRLAVFVLFVAVSFLVRADYLYWTTQNSPSWAINGSGEFVFNCASIKVSETGDTLKNYTLVGEDHVQTEVGNYIPDGLASKGMTFFVDVTGLAEMSFYIEYYVYDSATDYNVTGMSQVETYAQLAEAGYISEDMEYKPATDVWLGSGYMVPEPTGGVLMLLGLGLLGLRRRNREVA